MTTVGVYEAKTKLAKLLDQVARGREVTITRHGVPVAKLVAIDRHPARPVEVVARELIESRKGRNLGRLSLSTAIAWGRR